MFTPGKGGMKFSRVGVREDGQRSPHDTVIFEQKPGEGKEQAMEIPKRSSTPGKRSRKDKELKSGMFGIFQDHREGPEGWREQVTSEGLGKDGETMGPP